MRRRTVWVWVVLLVWAAAVVGARPASAEEPPATGEPFTIGQSVEGQPIEGRRFGYGARAVVIVGAIHGNERNTEVLVRRVEEHFAASLHLLPPDVSLYLLPALNPDGLREGSRYNAHGVDLNRNWASDDWTADATDPSGTRTGLGGTHPFSEPETAAMAEWLLALRDQSEAPVTVLFYHSAYPPTGLVLPGSVGKAITNPFADALGYATSARWSAYPVTGTAVYWCLEHDLRCFETELPSRANLSDAAMQRHAGALLGVLLWEQIQPGQRCFLETGYCIAGRIRDFWQRQGGVAVFGLPVSGQHETEVDGVVRQVQVFERHRLELHPENPAPADVQVGRLGVARLEQQGRNWWLFPKVSDVVSGTAVVSGTTTTDSDADCRFFPETQHRVCGEFLRRWQAAGIEQDGRPGSSTAEHMALYGLPLSEAQPETLADGRTALVQWFERARFEQYPEGDAANRVHIGLLGSEFVQYNE